MKRKTLNIVIALLFTVPSYAQQETIDLEPLRSDTGIEHKQGGFIGFVGKVLDWFSDYDTTYVSPNKYKYALMVDHYTNYEFYTIRSNQPNKQKIRFSPNPHNKIGLYFGWQIFFIGWSIDINDLGKHTNGSNKGTDFELSLYSAKIGVDLYYRRTSNDYKIHKLSGFPSDVPKDYAVHFRGLKVDMKGINIFYVLNNRKFSYPAAYSQSTNQRRNAGSFIAGFSFTKHNLHFDYDKLPLIIQMNMNPEMKVNHIKYQNYGINFGYAYNWVFARNFLADLSISPELSYNVSRIESEDVSNNDWDNRLKVDFILRAGIVYNNSKWYGGACFVGRTFDFSQRHFNLNNGFGTLQVYVGFNFGLKKEYKEAKEKAKLNHREHTYLY